MGLFAWFICVLLILVNALYVAAEFAAVGVRRSQVYQLAEEGNSLAKRLLPILEDSHKLDSYIAACQIGITLSSLILGAFGQAAIAPDLAELLRTTVGLEPLAAQSAAAAIILLLLTTFQVVFGELVPKSLALQFPTRMALLTYVPTRWSLALYSWFISVLNGSGLLILKAFGMENAGGHRHIHSPEEIDMLIAESRDGGLLEPEEQQRLHQALHLGRRTARQLMVPRRLVEAVDVDADPERVLQIAMNSPYTRLPVYRGSLDNVIGMLHTKDVAVRFARTGRAPRVEELIRSLIYVPTSVTADRLLAQLRERRGRLAVVLDEHGGFEGIVTLEDVLSELVGGLADEFKGEEPEPERLEDGRVRLPGMMLLDEAQEWIGQSLNETEADTVAGWVLDALGTVPRGGERVTIDGLEVEVEQVEHKAIVSVLVTPLHTGEALSGSEGEAVVFTDTEPVRPTRTEDVNRREGGA